MTWYGSEWKRRIPLSLDTSLTTSGSFTFQVAIPISFDDFWDNVRTDGFDVVIIAQNGNQPI